MSTAVSPPEEPVRVRGGAFTTSMVVDGHTIGLRVKRFSVGEYAAFSRDRARLYTPETDRIALLRKLPDEFERIVPTEAAHNEHARSAGDLAKVQADVERMLAQSPSLTVQPVGVALVAVLRIATDILDKVAPEERYRIPDDEVRRRRLSEMSADEFERFKALEQDEERFAAEFITTAIRTYISVPAGQMVVEEDDETETAVTTGEQLLRLYAGRIEIVRGLLNLIWRENTLSDALKNVSRPRSASIRSSVALAKAAPGPTPDEVASLAASAACASSDDVTACSETSAIDQSSIAPPPPSCGSMAMSR